LKFLQNGGLIMTSTCIPDEGLRHLIARGNRRDDESWLSAEDYQVVVEELAKELLERRGKDVKET
jgi:hypothetical protein